MDDLVAAYLAKKEITVIPTGRRSMSRNAMYLAAHATDSEKEEARLDAEIADRHYRRGQFAKEV